MRGIRYTKKLHEEGNEIFRGSRVRRQAAAAGRTHKDSPYNGRASPMFKCIEIGVGAAHVTRPHSMAPPFMSCERERHHSTSGRKEKGERAPLPSMGMQFVSARAQCGGRRTLPARHKRVPLARRGALLSAQHIWPCVCLHTAGVI